MDNLLILIIIIFNFFLFSRNDLISNKINLFDLPDNNRKIHSKKIALTGGVFIFVNHIHRLLIINNDQHTNFNIKFPYDGFKVCFIFLFYIFKFYLYLFIFKDISNFKISYNFCRKNIIK